MVFVFGLPLVPLWGVWADKYSRKAIIIRSAVVEALVLGLVSISKEPWHLAATMLVVGFQLGNSGVMLAALRDVTPGRRLGTVIGLFGASHPIGFAIGPAVGGLMVDVLHTSMSAVYALSALLSLASALLLAAALREVRPQTPPRGRVLQLAFGAVRGVVTEPITRRLFLLLGIALLARQMITPFLPLLVEHAHGSQAGLASAVALVVGTAALVGGLASPLTGAFGDRLGFRRVLALSMGTGGIITAAMPFAPEVPVLAAANVAFAMLMAGGTAMVFSLLAVEVPVDRRSATLNLAYLPFYVAGIIGPAIGALVAGSSVAAVFIVAGAILAIGALWVRAAPTPVRDR